MTKIIAGRCFHPLCNADAWDVRLIKPTEAGAIVEGWLVLDEGQSKDEDMYYRCVHISYIDVFENNGERYYVRHSDNSVYKIEETKNE